MCVSECVCVCVCVCDVLSVTDVASHNPPREGQCTCGIYDILPDPPTPFHGLVPYSGSRGCLQGIVVVSQ